ncbi:DUF3667 domain-containing protein [Algoriphagus taiwanensis]|uniref:DUF3667 domain-containing protein n=1 Tax=Algoriphagus taiwanensis TaxID=1445656 RepID=A0ABQ6PZK4_9BACT|nr:hypothetical protein Ataiwa_16510 [Algoriphagus taiwanensis]
MNCKNCGNLVEENFCGNCGQSIKISRINFSGFINDLSDSVFQVNRGLFFTIWELIVRPGIAIKNFLQGKRKPYFKPFAFLLTTSTFYFLLAEFTDQSTWLDSFYSGWISGASDLNQESNAEKVLSWFVYNFRISTLFLLPVYSFACFLSFRKFGFNFLEFIVINCYVSGQQALIYGICTLGEALFQNQLFESSSFFLSTGYAFWVFWKLFDQAKPAGRVFRTLLTYLLYLTFGTLLLFAAMAVITLAQKI